MPNRRVAIVKQRCLGHSNSVNTRREGESLGTHSGNPLSLSCSHVEVARVEDNNTGS